MKRFALLTVMCIASVMSFAQEYNIPTYQQLYKQNPLVVTHNYEYDVTEIEQLRSQAEQGDANAQYELYHHYALEKDTLAAISYLSLAAENEHPGALYELGCCYKTGKWGMPIWKEKAQSYLFRASELGNKSAKKELEAITKGRFKNKEKAKLRKAVSLQIKLVAPK